MKIDSVTIRVSVDRKIVSLSAQDIINRLVALRVVWPVGDFRSFIISTTSFEEAKALIPVLASVEEIQKGEDEKIMVLIQ